VIHSLEIVIILLAVGAPGEVGLNPVFFLLT
jgi:hypothetical protein